MPLALVGHIKRGIEEAKDDKKSILIFSGGQTRLEAGPRSEAYSYYSVASLNRFFGYPFVKSRTFIEEYARDSFENLLFSICRFKEVTKKYPTKVKVISFSFKEYRFSELHRVALRFPIENFEYISSDPETSKLRGSNFDLEKFDYFEKEFSIKPFEIDPYGCFSEVLSKKREERNPFLRNSPYSLSCPELRNIFEWCGPSLFPESLPWS